MTGETEQFQTGDDDLNHGLTGRNVRLTVILGIVVCSKAPFLTQIDRQSLLFKQSLRVSEDPLGP